MPIRIPVKADTNLRAAFEDVELRLQAIEKKQFAGMSSTEKQELAKVQGTLKKFMESPQFEEIGDDVTFASLVTFLETVTFEKTITCEGNIKAENRLLIEDGSAAEPSLAFADDLDTGLFRQADNQIGVVAGGKRIATIFLAGTSNYLDINDYSNPATELIRIQKESGAVGYIIQYGPDNLHIGTNTASTGGALYFRTRATDRWFLGAGAGHFQPTADNTYDVGSTTYGIKDLHIEGDVHVNGVNRGQPEGDETIFAGSKSTDTDIVTATVTDVAWADLYDPRGWVAAPHANCIPDIAGTYQAILQGSWAEVIPTGQARLYVYKNTTIIGISHPAIVNLAGGVVMVTADMNGTTDYFKCAVYQSTGSNKQIDASRFHFTVRKIG